MAALTIRDVSRRSGLSEPTLRYYEEIGLGVRLPGTARRLAGPAAPEVGDYAAVDEEGERRS